MLIQAEQFLGELKEYRGQIDEAIAKLEALGQNGVPTGRPGRKPGRPKGAKAKAASSGKPRGRPRSDLTQRIEAHLRAKGPASTKQLVERFGVSSGSSHNARYMSVYQRLTKNGQFRKTAEGLWGVK
jgi:hypothetical protein